MDGLHIKIKKENITNLIFIFFIIRVLFIKWYFGFSHPIIYPIILLALIIIFKKFIITKKQGILLILLLIYTIINVCITKNGHYYIKEEMFYYNFIEFCTLIIFSYITHDKNNYEDIISNKLFYIINIYYFINFIIMIKQINNTYFMMRHIEHNLFYIDHITGMIGESGTHRLSLFNLFCIFLNYINFDSKNKIKALIAKIFFVFTIISSIYISTFNDNRAYYYLLIIFGIPIILDYFKKSVIKKKIVKTIIVTAIIIFALFLLYRNNNNFKNFIDDKIMIDIFERTSNKFDKAKEDEEERIVLFKYALTEGNGYTYGSGIGYIRLIGDSRMPRHFGISEITSRVYNGGLIYIIILYLIYTSFFTSYFSNVDSLTKIVIYIGTIFLIAYQQIFSVNDETILCCLLFSIFNMMNKKIKEKKNEV